MGGAGNASQILFVLSEVQLYSKWQRYFESFEFPYSFLSVEQYESLLLNSGFIINRVELISKDWSMMGKPALRVGFVQHGYLIHPEYRRNKETNLLKQYQVHTFRKYQ